MNRGMVLAILVMVPIALLNGCWDRRDPELRGHVTAVAFDVEEGGGFHVIAQISNHLALTGGQNGDRGAGEARSFWVVSANGRTPLDAMRNLAPGTSRELFWAYTEVVLLSEELARRGVGPVMDLFERERQLRTGALIAVVTGDLRMLMESEAPLDETGSKGLHRLMFTLPLERSTFPTKRITDLYMRLAAPGQEMLIGKMQVLVEDWEEEHVHVPPATVGGAALFRGDRMVGWADGEEVVGWAYASGRSTRCKMLIEPPGEETPISLSLSRVMHQIRPVHDDGGVRIELTLHGEGEIQSFPAQGNLALESEFIRSLEKRAAESIRSRIEATLARSQELNSDILGLGNLIYRKNYGLWNEIGEDWDDIFPTLVVDIKVHVNIARTGLTTDSLQIGGGK